MRMVPRRPPLKLGSRRCSTKLGRSVEPVSGSQSMGRPSLAEIEVKVPHSWTLSSEGGVLFCEMCPRES